MGPRKYTYSCPVSNQNVCQKVVEVIIGSKVCYLLKTCNTIIQ